MGSFPPLLSFLLLPLLVSSFAPVRVSTPRGKVDGFHVDLGSNSSALYHGQADVFLGIPYAFPPTGPLRFKKPLARPFYGLFPLNASFARPQCPQLRDKFPMSEDCLYLNVITPDASLRGSSRLPVMVYIHGGSLQEGSARDFEYEGAIRNYATRGVVVVVIQYRLGVLGFFTTHTAEFPANLGMLDQVEALKWVQSQIGHFGGDANRVTLFGNSAGAISISAHTYSPLSKNLFNGAIMQSGSVLTLFEERGGLTGTSEQYAFQLCNFTSADLAAGRVSRLHACLSSLPYSAWLPFEAANLRGWKFSVDGHFLPASPSALASTRRKIPLIYGTEKDEYTALIYSLLGSGAISLPQIGRPLWQMQVHALLSHLSLEHRVTLQHILESYYLPAGTGENDPLAWLHMMNEAFTGGIFVAAIHEDIRQQMRYKNDKVFVYEHSYGSRIMMLPPLGTWRPAVHTAELVYVYGNPSQWQPAIALGQVDARDFSLLEWFADSWTTFAKTGTPGGEWAAVQPTSGKINYIDIAEEGNVATAEYRSKDEFVWRYVVDEHLGTVPV